MEEVKEVDLKFTLGGRRVKAEFNPAKNDIVDQIKNKSAELINLIEDLKKFDHNFEPPALVSSGEQLRQISLAQTKIETGCMYAVKACFTD